MLGNCVEDTEREIVKITAFSSRLKRQKEQIL